MSAVFILVIVGLVLSVGATMVAGEVFDRRDIGLPMFLVGLTALCMGLVVAVVNLF